MAVLLTLAAATPALAGPPWITVEVRPHGFQSIVIHTFHHGTANPMPLRGTAYGLVNGRRVTVTLRIDAIADGNNSYAVARSWGDDGVWVLSISDAEGGHGGAGVAVMIDRSGTVTVRYPRLFNGQTRTATDAEISAMLSTLDEQYLPPLQRLGWQGLSRMSLPVLLLALLGLVVVRAMRGASQRWRARRAAIA